MSYYQRRWLARAARVLVAVMVALSGMARYASATSVGDVFLITMENHNFTQPGNVSSPQPIFGNANAPYLNSLITVNNANAAQTSWASNYTSLGSGIHPSEPNYIWTEAGTNFGVTNDNLPFGSGGNEQNTNQHLTGLLQQSGISWKSYQEDIDVSTSTGAVLAQSSWTVPLNNISGTFSSGTNPYNGSNQFNYAPKHNPAVYFNDTSGGNDTSTNNPQRLKYAPMQQLQTDLTNNTVSKFNWITPDQFNDMHTALTGGFTYHGNHLTGDSAQIAQGDSFLATVVPQIMASQAYQNNGAILIWFDETEGGDTSSFTLPYILISPLAKGNAYQSTVNFTHSSTLRTLQEIFQVGGTSVTGFLGGASSASDEADMFQSGVIPTGMCTWTGGGGNGNWSTTSDWIFAPANGNSLVFAGSTQTSTTNNSLTSVSSITFDGTAGSFSLSGNALTIAGGITNNSTNAQTIGLNLTLSAAQSFNAASGNLTLNGTIASGGNALTITGSSTTTLTSTVSGGVALMKSGAGTLVLSGNNSYSGGTTLSNGTVQLGNTNGLGSSAAGVTVNGGILDLHAFSPTVGALNGSGGTVRSNVGGAVSFTVGNGGAGGSYAGTVVDGSGTVGLIKTGAGTQTLSGSNSYSGGTTVTGGTLQLGHVNAMGSTTAGVTVNTGGTLDLHGFSPTVGALGGTGGAIQSNIAGAVSLTAGNGGGSGSYAGIIQNGSGTVSLIKTGAGTQTLSGNNTYSGGTTVGGGTLVAGHIHALGTGGLTINNTALTQLQAGLTGPVQLPSLTMAGGATPTATLDITDNNLIVHNGNLATLAAQAAHAATANLDWTGTGLTSTTARDDANLVTAVGVIQNDDGGGSPLYTTWPAGADSGGAVSVSLTDVLAKYTYYGDADLDGVVNASFDYDLWSAGFAGAGTGWEFGDFDYSGGFANSSIDYDLWAAGNAASAGSPLSSGVQPVPEPNTLVLIALGFLGAVALQGRRRRPS